MDDQHSTQGAPLFTAKTYIIISALGLLFSAWYATYVGFLIIPSLVLLFIQRPSWLNMVVWSSFLFVGHMWWVALFSWQHLSFSWWQAIGLYVGLISYFVTMSVAYWRLVSVFLLSQWWRHAQFCFLVVFFYMVSHAMPFLSGLRGYPFLQPFLPLIAWICPGDQLPPMQWVVGDIPLLYLPPVLTKSRIAVGQGLLKRINSIAPQPQGIIVSPESTFSWPLHEHSEEVGWWQSVMPYGAEWLFGATWQEGSEKFQSAVCCNNSLITQITVKSHLIPLFESCFSPEKIEAVWRGRDVYLCNEALCLPQKANKNVPIVLINESWLLPWVQELFYAALWWRFMGRAIVVGHKRAVCFSPLH